MEIMKNLWNNLKMWVYRKMSLYVVIYRRVGNRTAKVDSICSSEKRAEHRVAELNLDEDIIWAQQFSTHVNKRIQY